jgi:hypothetical protein
MYRKLSLLIIDNFAIFLVIDFRFFVAKNIDNSKKFKFFFLIFDKKYFNFNLKTDISENKLMDFLFLLHIFLCFGVPNRGPKLGSKMGVQKGGFKWGSKMGVQNGASKWGSKMGVQYGGPKWESKVGVQNRGPKWGSKKGVQNQRCR